MISQRELDGAIRECEDAPISYRNCEKLATFYTIRDHMQNETPVMETSHAEPQSVGDYGKSEFLQAIKDKNNAEMWALMDELMHAVLVTNPRLYQGTMRRIKEQG